MVAPLWVNCDYLTIIDITWSKVWPWILIWAYVILKLCTVIWSTNINFRPPLTWDFLVCLVLNFHTYLLIAALPSSPACYWTYLKSPHAVNFDANCTSSNLKLWRLWTESHQIYTRCTAMITDYSSKIKIAMLNPFWNASVPNGRQSSNFSTIFTFYPFLTQKLLDRFSSSFYTM